MESNTKLLAYCGFYCGDCLGYTGVIADAAQNMLEVLETYKFDRTAECVFPEELEDYDEFQKMLTFMAGLRCAGVCREGGQDRDSSGCEVRDCCRDRGFYACYECDDFERCNKLKSLHKELHTDSSLKNLRAIKELGLEAWIISGERHCYWREAESRP